MKKILFLLLFVFAVTAPISVHAQEQIGQYTYCGVEKPVSLFQQDQKVIIEAHDTGLGQLILLKGKESIESFRNSLINMKEEYISMKAENKDVIKTNMYSTFEKFYVYWSLPSKKDITLGGICNDFHPIFQATRNKKTKSLDYFAVIDERVKDILEDGGSAVLFICFQNENEIQSLIDVLNLCLERLSTSSSPNNATTENSQNATTENSQNATTENSPLLNSKNFWRQDAKDFKYTKAGSAEVEIRGIISPSEIDTYHVLLMRCRSYSDGNYYFAIPDEKTCNVWVSALTGMKELFIKNDKIAKENNVIADVNKFVSDKFNFEGYFVSLYTKNVDAINGGLWPVRIGVEYRYISGKSSMVMYMKQENAQRPSYSEKKWTYFCVFNSVQDFDEMINAITWENFMKAFNAQAQEIKQQQELEARKQREQALFD